MDVAAPSGPVRAVAWGAPPPKPSSSPSSSSPSSSSSSPASGGGGASAVIDEGRAERAEAAHRARRAAGPPRVEVDWAVKSKKVDLDAPSRAGVKGGAVRWGRGPPPPSSDADAAAATTTAEARSARAAAAEAAAVARMRATEPRLPFDHCVVDAKSDLDRVRVRPRGPGPPAQTRVKESGRPRQVAAELTYLAARMEAAGRVKPARECLRKCVSTLEDALGLEHPEVGKAVRLLADLTHSQFGKTKEGKKEAVGLYQRSADIAVLTYGYEHPTSVAALVALEEVRRVPHRPPPRATSGTGPRHMLVDYAHVDEKTDMAVPSRPVRAVRWRHPEPERADVTLAKYGYGYGGSVAFGGGREGSRGGRGGGGADAETAARLQQQFVKTRIF